MTTVTQMKCACESCLCVVSLADAIQKDNKPYCSQACADGHPMVVAANILVVDAAKTFKSTPDQYI